MKQQIYSLLIGIIISIGLINGLVAESHTQQQIDKSYYSYDLLYEYIEIVCIEKMDYKFDSEESKECSEYADMVYINIMQDIDNMKQDKE